MLFNDTHCVVEEEEAAEEAEEVSGEQREVDRRSAGHLHHYGHEAVQRVHTQGVDCKQHGCRTQWMDFSTRRWRNILIKRSFKATQLQRLWFCRSDGIKYSDLTRQEVNLQMWKSHFIAATAWVSRTALQCQETQSQHSEENTFFTLELKEN